jgi:hypothetical protein
VHAEGAHAVLEGARGGVALGVARDPHHEEVTDALVEDELDGNPRVGAAQHADRRRLAVGAGLDDAFHFPAVRLEIAVAEAFVAFRQFRAGLTLRDAGGPLVRLAGG